MSKRRTREPNEPTTAPVRYRERNEGQKEAARLFKLHQIVCLIGPAGTGKTNEMVALALESLARGAESVIITRPAKEIEGEELGFRKGDVDEKMHPFMLPILDVLRTLLGNAEAVKMFKRFEVCPLAYVRGRTFSNCVAILDEAQNATRLQRKTYLTRLGKEPASILISGDPTQCDIRGGGKLFEREVEAWKRDGIAGVAVFDQSMQMRSPLLAKIEKCYAELG